MPTRRTSRGGREKAKRDEDRNEYLDYLLEFDLIDEEDDYHKFLLEKREETLARNRNANSSRPRRRRHQLKPKKIPDPNQIESPNDDEPGQQSPMDDPEQQSKSEIGGNTSRTERYPPVSQTLNRYDESANGNGDYEDDFEKESGEVLAKEVASGDDNDGDSNAHSYTSYWYTYPDAPSRCQTCFATRTRVSICDWKENWAFIILSVGLSILAVGLGFMFHRTLTESAMKRGFGSGCNIFCYFDNVCERADNGSFYCKCKPGFSGDLCQYHRPCDIENVCLNGGQCIDLQVPYKSVFTKMYKCKCPRSFYGENCQYQLPTDCASAIAVYGKRKSGVYSIDLQIGEEHISERVVCDEGGPDSEPAMIIFQRFASRPASFDETLETFVETGIGKLGRENSFMLRFDLLSKLTTAGKDYGQRLIVELTFDDGSTARASYDKFQIKPDVKGDYRLHVSCYNPSSKAGDALLPLDNQTFKTRPHSCVAATGGAWWYRDDECFDGQLTGRTVENRRKTDRRFLMTWKSYRRDKFSDTQEWPLLKKAVMKIQLVEMKSVEDCSDDSSAGGLLHRANTCPSSALISPEPDLMPPGQVYRFVNMDYRELFCEKDPEFSTRYNTGKNRQPALFQRLKTASSTAKSRPDTFANHDSSQFKNGFGNPYFDYYVGHKFLSSYDAIELEIKDEETKEIGRTVYKMNLALPRNSNTYELKLKGFGAVGGVESKGPMIRDALFLVQELKSMPFRHCQGYGHWFTSCDKRKEFGNPFGTKPTWRKGNNVVNWGGLRYNLKPKFHQKMAEISSISFYASEEDPTGIENNFYAPACLSRSIGNQPGSKNDFSLWSPSEYLIVSDQLHQEILCKYSGEKKDSIVVMKRKGCSVTECEEPFERKLTKEDYEEGVGDITGPVYFIGLKVLKGWLQEGGQEGRSSLDLRVMVRDDDGAKAAVYTAFNLRGKDYELALDCYAFNDTLLNDNFEDERNGKSILRLGDAFLDKVNRTFKFTSTSSPNCGSTAFPSSLQGQKLDVGWWFHGKNSEPDCQRGKAGFLFGKKNANFVWRNKLITEAMLVVADSVPTSGCPLILDGPDCSKVPRDGLYPMREGVRPVFPEVYCEDRELTILARTTSVARESTYVDRQITHFKYNQVSEAADGKQSNFFAALPYIRYLTNLFRRKVALKVHLRGNGIQGASFYKIFELGGKIAEVRTLESIDFESNGAKDWKLKIEEFGFLGEPDVNPIADAMLRLNASHFCVVPNAISPWWYRTDNCSSVAVPQKEPNPAARDPRLRLVPSDGGWGHDNETTGMLQVKIGGVWGGVCSSNTFGTEETVVACRGLGFEGGSRSEFTYIMTLAFVMSNVRCSGNETSLFDCPHGDGTSCKEPSQPSNWQSYMAVGIICKRVMQTPSQVNLGYLTGSTKKKGHQGVVWKRYTTWAKKSAPEFETEYQELQTATLKLVKVSSDWENNWKSLQFDFQDVRNKRICANSINVNVHYQVALNVYKTPDEKAFDQFDTFDFLCVDADNFKVMSNSNKKDFFARSASDFAMGFGNVFSDHWVGLFVLKEWSRRRRNEASQIKVNMQTAANSGTEQFHQALYSDFRVADSFPYFTINQANYCHNKVESGKLIAGDGLHKKMVFRTYSDHTPLVCAEPQSVAKEERARHVTGWWYSAECGGKDGEKNKEGSLTASGAEFYWRSEPMEQPASSLHAEPLISAEILMGGNSICVNN